MFSADVQMATSFSYKFYHVLLYGYVIFLCYCLMVSKLHFPELKLHFLMKTIFSCHYSCEIFIFPQRELPDACTFTCNLQKKNLHNNWVPWTLPPSDLCIIVTLTYHHVTIAESFYLTLCAACSHQQVFLCSVIFILLKSGRFLCMCVKFCMRLGQTHLKC